jgi:hypothetical protein
VSIGVPPAHPPLNKRKRDTTSTQAGHQGRSIRQRKDKTTVHVAQHIHTIHTKHKGTIQPQKYTDCTVGENILLTHYQACAKQLQIALLVRLYCTVVGMEIIQTNLFKKIQ